MNEIAFGVLGVVLGFGCALAGMFFGARYWKSHTLGALSKPVYLGISSGLMLGIVLPAAMHSVVLPQATWLPTLRWLALLAMALIALHPVYSRRRARNKT